MGSKADRSGAVATAQYISSLAQELARLAAGHQLEALAYLLNMVRLEAEQVAEDAGDGGAPSPAPRIHRPSF